MANPSERLRAMAEAAVPQDIGECDVVRTVHAPQEAFVLWDMAPDLALWAAEAAEALEYVRDGAAILEADDAHLENALSKIAPLLARLADITQEPADG